MASTKQNLDRVAAAALVAAVAGWLTWNAVYSETTFFLPGSGWICHPHYADPYVHKYRKRTVLFRKSFAGRAVVSLRALTSYKATLNGDLVGESSGNWKRSTVYELDGGALEVEVSCSRSPPALCCEINGLPSDESWEASQDGKEWRPAALCDAPLSFPPDSEIANSEAPAWRHREYALAAVLACVLCFVRGVWLPVVLSVATCVLAANNLKAIPYLIGYDVWFHLEYVRYLYNWRQLPLPNHGMEMWQPPLYYLLGAILTHGSILGLRLIALCLAIANIWIAWCALKKSEWRWAATLFAGSVPVQLYMLHYISNDMLAGTLASIAFVLSIAISEHPSRKKCIWLGLVSGAAAVTKLTAWPVVGCAVLFAMLRCSRKEALAIVTTAAILPAIYFASNFHMTGHFMPVDQGGYGYWQDPGFAVLPNFYTFGRSLTHPYYCAITGAPDGLFAGLFGDSGWGGKVFENRPPWNYELMASNYWLALLPAVLMAIGFLRCLWKRPMIAATVFSAIGGVCYFYLQHPSYGAIKGQYLLPCMVPIAFLLAEGIGAVRRWRPALFWGLAFWAVASWTPLFVGDSDEAVAWRAQQAKMNLNLWQGR